MYKLKGFEKKLKIKTSKLKNILYIYIPHNAL